MHAAPRRSPRIRTLVLAMTLGVMAAACANQHAASPAASPAAADAVATAAAPAGEMRAAAGQEVKGLANHNGSQLAYDLDVRVRLPAAKIEGNLGSVRDACNEQKFGPCDVLGEEFGAGDIPSGELQMRAAPEAIAGLVKAASDGGEVAERSTHAEDLADAVRDNGLRRKRLELQHSKLVEIIETRRGSIEELVNLSDRLAELEAEIAQADQEAAQQQRRIASNKLSLHFEAENISVATLATSHISEALHGLTGTWDTIVAWMITVFLGALLPFALLFGVVGWLVVMLLRRLNRRAAPPSAKS